MCLEGFVSDDEDEIDMPMTAGRASLRKMQSNVQSKIEQKQKDNNRKRIKNLRRRVYDSLNVFLACNIFTKDRKKVTFNKEIYDCLPAHFKAFIDEQDILMAGTTTNLSTVKMVTSPAHSDGHASPQETSLKDEESSKDHSLK